MAVVNALRSLRSDSSPPRRWWVLALRAKISKAAISSLALDLGVGGGALWTVDDLEDLQAVGVPDAIATERQIHPSLNWAVGPRVGLGKGWDGRIRLKGAHWIETLETVIRDRRAQLDLSVAIAHTF